VFIYIEAPGQNNFRFQHDSFNVLFEEVARMAGILYNNLVVTYDGVRVFASTTPHSIKIWRKRKWVSIQKTYISSI